MGELLKTGVTQKWMQMNLDLMVKGSLDEIRNYESTLRDIFHRHKENANYESGGSHRKVLENFTGEVSPWVFRLCPWIQERQDYIEKRADVHLNIGKKSMLGQVKIIVSGVTLHHLDSAEYEIGTLALGNIQSSLPNSPPQDFRQPRAHSMYTDVDTTIYATNETPSKTLHDKTRKHKFIQDVSKGPSHTDVGTALGTNTERVIAEPTGMVITVENDMTTSKLISQNKMETGELLEHTSNRRPNVSLGVKSEANKSFSTARFGDNTIIATTRASMKNVRDLSLPSPMHGNLFPESTPSTIGKDASLSGCLEGLHLSTMTPERIHIHIYHGDITEVNADVIVNAANSNLSHGAGVARAISRRGGHEIQLESTQYVQHHGPLETGEVCITASGRLSCKHVIHAVGPAYDYDGDLPTIINTLHALIIRVLDVASDKIEAKSIAFPAISAGMYGLPIERCAETFRQAIQRYSKSRLSRTSITDIHIVNKDEDGVGTFIIEFFTNLDTQDTTISATATDDQGATTQTFDHGVVDTMAGAVAPPTETRLIHNETALVNKKYDSMKAFNNTNPSHWATRGSLPTVDSHTPSSIPVSPADHRNAKAKYDRVTPNSHTPQPSPSSFPGSYHSGNTSNTEIHSTWALPDRHRSSHVPVSPRRQHYSSNGRGMDAFLPVVTAAADSHHSSTVSDSRVGHPYSTDGRGMDTHSSLVTTDNYPSHSVPSPPHSYPYSGDRRDMKTHSSLTTLKRDWQSSTPGPHVNKSHEVKGRTQNQPGSKSKSTNVPATSTTDISNSSGSKGDCDICTENDVSLTVMKCCQNTICHTCFGRHFQTSGKCPFCSLVVLVKKGNQPEGRMKVVVETHTHLPGYDRDGTIVISYHFPDGFQTAHHPSPGKPYSGTHRTAYLPDNLQGQEVLKLLEKAFDLRLLFTIGRSVTTGVDNCVVWNDVHHKTSRIGGPQGYGYPDPSYLDRVKDELAAKGVK